MYILLYIFMKFYWQYSKYHRKYYTICTTTYLISSTCKRHRYKESG